MLRRTFLALTFAGWLSAGAPVISGIDSVGVTVSDLDRSVAFYSKVLHFQKVSEREVEGDAWEQLEGVFGLHARTVRMRLGGEFIELTEYLAPKGHPYPPDSRSNDRWFQHIAIVVSDMDQAYRWLRENKVEHASTSPQRLPDWNKKAAGIRAFYFKDPDGHVLEILSFPPDKGDPKWHQPDSALFLGIDHTAIVVAETDASLRFYRDALSFRVAGESENYGVEQERLNQVFGAHLRITSMRAGSGPGIEFLEYLAPSGGRPYPPDTKANDLLQWQTTLVAPHAEAASQALHDVQATYVSNGFVSVPEATYGKATLVRDPDGHALLIAQP